MKKKRAKKKTIKKRRQAKRNARRHKSHIRSRDIIFFKTLNVVALAVVERVFFFVHFCVHDVDVHEEWRKKTAWKKRGRKLFEQNAFKRTSNCKKKLFSFKRRLCIHLCTYTRMHTHKIKYKEKIFWGRKIWNGESNAPAQAKSFSKRKIQRDQDRLNFRSCTLLCVYVHTYIHTYNLNCVQCTWEFERVSLESNSSLMMKKSILYRFNRNLFICSCFSTKLTYTALNEAHFICGRKAYV